MDGSGAVRHLVDRRPDVTPDRLIAQLVPPPTFSEVSFDTYIPAQFYYNPQNARTRQFEQTYRRWFHEGLQVNYNPRFGLTGYDHAQFFLRGLGSKGKAFRGTKGQSTYTPLQTPLRFRQVGDAGMQNESFQLIHYTRDHRIEAVAY